MFPQIIGFIVAVVIVVGASVYLYQSGSFALLKHTFTFHLSSSTFSYAPNATNTASHPASPSPSQTSRGSFGGQASPPPSTPSRPPIDPSQIPKGFTAQDLSPHFKRIRIASASAGYGGSSYGQISLYASLDQNEQVDITGWQFKANHGGTFIPGGVSVYQPYGASEGDMFLQNGDYAYFYSTGGADRKNVRLNKCMGYLNNNVAVTPAFPQSCPSPDRSEIRGFSGQCQDYILSLGSCREPSGNPPISFYDYGCRSYLDNLNYKGCFSKYRGDPDFLSHEWRVWLGSEILDSRHDDLRLLDQKGLLVDEYSY